MHASETHSRTRVCGIILAVSTQQRSRVRVLWGGDRGQGGLGGGGDTTTIGGD